jgi:ribosomal protein L11 methyltransferase
MLHLLFSVKKTYISKAKQFLVSFSKEPLYEIESKDLVEIGGFFSELPKDLPDYLKDFKTLNDEIDWEDQWKTFSPNYKDNIFELNLEPYGFCKTVYLKPGPGFGDLSHPTTRLCLKALALYVKGKEVLDLGCGSGILSVFSYACLAKKVFSLDIDPDAIIHTKENLALNLYPQDSVTLSSDDIHFTDPEPLCVINMTFGDQKSAIKSLSKLPKDCLIISSGILTHQQKAYIKFMEELGFSIKKTDQEDCWASFFGKKIKD